MQMKIQKLQDGEAEKVEEPKDGLDNKKEEKRSTKTKVNFKKSLRPSLETFLYSKKKRNFSRRQKIVS
ncbi:hypothetical protein KHA80_11485 [Anaerobacillus sp. HL2]|nr:hypothetical protein KHA80_11485 [Anaerobacillus sp. HL2]